MLMCMKIIFTLYLSVSYGHIGDGNQHINISLAKANEY